VTVTSTTTYCGAVIRVDWTPPAVCAPSFALVWQYVHFALVLLLFGRIPLEGVNATVQSGRVRRRGATAYLKLENLYQYTVPVRSTVLYAMDKIYFLELGATKLGQQRRHDTPARDDYELLTRNRNCLLLKKLLTVLNLLTTNENCLHE
jgi:hypothetical protein